MQKIVQFFILFTSILYYASCDDSDYCYAKDTLPYQYFLDWTSYDAVKGPTVIDRACSPIYVWALIKHGIKSLTDEQIQRNKNLFTLKEGIQLNNKEKRSALCTEDYENINSWNNALDKKQDEELAKTAYNNHEQFAAYLGDFIDSSTQRPTKDNFDFQTSKTAGAIASALRLTNKLLGSNADKIADNGVTENDVMLKARNDCYKWGANANSKEMDAFVTSPVYQALAYSMSNRLGFTYPVSSDNITAMYESCIIGNTLTTTNNKPPFCAAFLQQDLKVMEYKGDLKHYYEFGYGNPLSEKMGCPLVRDMVDKLGKVSSGTMSGKKGAFYFGDEENVMGLITKLGLNRDEEALKHNNYQYQKDNRNWRSSRASPYTATIHAVVFNCANSEKKVEFYHNQNIVKLEACKTISGNKCPLDTFLSEVKKTLKEDKCDEDYCGSAPAGSDGNMINYSFIVTIACFVFSRLRFI